VSTLTNLDPPPTVRSKRSVSFAACVSLRSRLVNLAAPNACDNFLCLCDGSKGKAKGSGQSLHYKEVPFHRIVPGKIVQGGDFAMKNGTGGESIWGGTFKDEKGGLKLKHGKRGVLSMCNSGKNSNGSQFFLTFDKISSLDGKHVVFGEVIAGMEVLDMIEAVPICSEGKPQVTVVIADCGILEGFAAP